MMQHHHLSRSAGFTLTELIITMAMIAILGVVAVPTFLTYMEKSRISTTVASSDAIRSALAGYAATQPTMSYPDTINDYDSLVTLVNQHGGQLPLTPVQSRFTLEEYTPLDRENDGDYESYTLRLRVSSVPTSRSGWCVVITPSAITKCNPV
jgi:prepilin-type N-terminal cleavage/methylation domain-containing protein